MVYSRRRFVLCLTSCHFVLVFFSPFRITITSLGEEKANLSAFRSFVRVVLVWFCRFPLPLGVWEGLRFVIVTLPGLFSYLFFYERHAYSNILRILAPNKENFQMKTSDNFHISAQMRDCVYSLEPPPRAEIRKIYTPVNPSSSIGRVRPITPSFTI